MILDEPDLEDAILELRSSELDPPAAAQFVYRLLGPATGTSGSSRWIEMTPLNVLRARELYTIFPDMQLVHVARDGRDVACSVTPLPWGPTEPFAALDWWAKRMTEAHRATEGLGPEQLLEIRLEALTDPNSPAIERLWSFVGESPSDRSNKFLAQRVSPENAHEGRWLTDIALEARDEFDRRYSDVVREMTGLGVPADRWGFP